MSSIRRPGHRRSLGRAVLFIGLSAVLGTLLGGCTSYVNLPQEKVSPENAILLLNGEPLGLEDYDNDFRLMAIHYSAVSESDMRRMKRILSEQVIDRRILFQEARRKGVRITRAEFEKALQAATQDSPEDFTILLKKQGVTVEIWKRGILLKLFIDKLIEREVFRKVRITRPEVEEYYWSHLQDAWSPEAVRVRHLVVRSILDLAKAKKRIKDGEPFERVAAELSAGPQKAEGGLWDWMPVRDLSPVYGKVLLLLGTNEVSEVCRDSFGYHMFQFLAYRPRTMRPLSVVAGQIHDRLLKEEQDFRFDQWLTGLKEKAVIRVNQEMAPLMGEIPEVPRAKPYRPTHPVRRPAAGSGNP